MDKDKDKEEQETGKITVTWPPVAAGQEHARILAIIDEWHAYLKSLGRPNRVRATYLDALEVIRERFTREEK